MWALVLIDHQRPDGSWLDKWHASAFYATACCALALAEFEPARARPALARAVEWVLGTQRADGSWGRWRGTVEETAYAVQILARAGGRDRASAVAAAVARGCAFLAGPDAPADPASHPGLWHAKDLYAPVGVVRAARLAAVNLGAALAAAPSARGAGGAVTRRPAAQAESSSAAAAGTG
jgi:halimadienyl-diphosphate synthase